MREIKDLSKNILIKIGLECTLLDLLNFCTSSSKINNSICNNQVFWMKKLNKDFGIYKKLSIPKKYKLEKGLDYKSYYKYITNRLNDFKDNFDNLLIDSSKKGDLNIVKIVLNKGANINAKDNQALIWASYNGQTEIVKYLVESGANIHAQEDYALELASHTGRIKTVKYLVEAGANIYKRFLKDASENGYLEILEFLKNKL